MISPSEFRQHAEAGKALAALLAHNPHHHPTPDLIEMLSENLIVAADEIDRLRLQQILPAPRGVRRAA